MRYTAPWRPPPVRRPLPGGGRGARLILIHDLKRAESAFVLSLSASRWTRRCVKPVRRPSIPWRDWLPTIRSSTPAASAATTVTPNSGRKPALPFPPPSSLLPPRFLRLL